MWWILRATYRHPCSWAGVLTTMCAHPQQVTSCTMPCNAPKKHWLLRLTNTGFRKPPDMKLCIGFNVIWKNRDLSLAPPISQAQSSLKLHVWSCTFDASRLNSLKSWMLRVFLRSSTAFRNSLKGLTLRVCCAQRRKEEIDGAQRRKGRKEEINNRHAKCTKEKY